MNMTKPTAGALPVRYAGASKGEIDYARPLSKVKRQHNSANVPMAVLLLTAGCAPIQSLGLAEPCRPCTWQPRHNSIPATSQPLPSLLLALAVAQYQLPSHRERDWPFVRFYKCCLPPLRSPGKCVGFDSMRPILSQKPAQRPLHICKNSSQQASLTSLFHGKCA